MITLRQLFTISDANDDFSIHKWNEDLEHEIIHDKEDIPEEWLDNIITNICLRHGSVSAWYEIHLEEDK